MPRKETGKTVAIYKIDTTQELQKTVYFTDKLGVKGSFVKFHPYEIVVSPNHSFNKEDMEFILPDRVIEKIAILKVPIAQFKKKSHEAEGHLGKS